MGIIEYYDAIAHRPLARFTPEKPPEPERPVEYKPILDTSRVVTLSEFDPVSKEAITAHRIKDYRRRVFNFTLLPEIHLLLDDIMEGSTYWNDKLHNDSPYS